MKQTWAWFRSVTQYDPIISPYDLLLLMIASGYVHDHMIINDSMIKIQELFTCFLVFILFENGYEFWQSPSPFGCNLLPRSDRPRPIPFGAGSSLVSRVSRRAKPKSWSTMLLVCSGVWEQPNCPNWASRERNELYGLRNGVVVCDDANSEIRDWYHVRVIWKHAEQV